MFAHQSTKAWAALVGALFEAGLTVDATWPIDTELKNRTIALGTSSLESSITVVCRPLMVGSAASFKVVRREIEQVVREAVKRFWSYGFRGADLIVACYGPAVGVFGKYERVEKADGTPVGVPELLQLARLAARDTIAGEFRGDNLLHPVLCLGQPVRRRRAGLGRRAAGGADRRRDRQCHGGRPRARHLRGGRIEMPPGAAR